MFQGSSLICYLDVFSALMADGQGKRENLDDKL